MNNDLWHDSQRENPETALVVLSQSSQRSGKRLSRQVVALALCACLLGGAAGAGAMWKFGPGQGGSLFSQTSTITPVVLSHSSAGTAMNDAEIYAAAVNSVVSINTTSNSGVNIFGQSVQSASSGSGFVLTADGYILTNYHVVKDASTVEVTTYGGDTFQATVVGGDSDYDIAVLKVNASGLQPISLGNSDTLNVGDHVLAIGNPLGELTFSMSGGMVSSVNRAINVSGIPFHMIQTDTSINPGNSGGPLLDSSGQVVGIVSAKYSSSFGQSVEGIGFTIPINDVQAIVQDIIDNGYVTNKPYLGVTAGTVNAQMAQQAGLPQGVYLYAVDPNGAAASAGLQAGDVITEVDGGAIQSMTDLNAAKKACSVDDTSQFKVVRNGQTHTYSVTWDAAPDTRMTQAQTPQQFPAYGSGADPYAGLFGGYYGNGS